MTHAPVLGGPAPLGERVTFDADEMTYLMRAPRRAVLPEVLGWVPSGDTVEARSALTDAAAERLIARGLIDPAGHLHSALPALLDVIGAPVWCIDVRVVGHAPGVSGLRGCLCSNGIGRPVWTRVDEAGLTAERVHSPVPAFLATLLGDASGASIDPVDDHTEFVAERLAEIVPRCTRHVEIVGTRSDGTDGISSAPHRVGPVIAVYDNEFGRVVASTARSADGRSRTSMVSGTRPRLVGALGTLLMAVESAGRPEHLVSTDAVGSDHPMGSSGTRLPFVSNGGV